MKVHNIRKQQVVAMMNKQLNLIKIKKLKQSE